MEQGKVVSRGEGRGYGVCAPVLSDTLIYINLAGLATGLVASRGPMHLCACVSEERGDGEGAGSQALSDTLRYINLTGLARGLVALPGPMHLCPTSRLFLSPTSRLFM